MIPAIYERLEEAGYFYTIWLLANLRNPVRRVATLSDVVGAQKLAVEEANAGWGRIVAPGIVVTVSGFLEDCVHRRTR